MKRTFIATRGIGSWRERLANPERQWRRRYSAYEAAISWELAAKSSSGLPMPIKSLLDCAYGDSNLMFAVAEHKVSLPGGSAASQNDVWALVQTSVGNVSLTVEAKAQESFGNGTLTDWLNSTKSTKSRTNRELRWAHLRGNLPEVEENGYAGVAYQLLHRCASAVIEARRLKLSHAACVIQAFGTSAERFDEFSAFCRVIGMTIPRGLIQKTMVNEIELAIGWADCPCATDRQVADVR